MAALQKFPLILFFLMTTVGSARANEAKIDAELEPGRAIYLKRCEVCHLIGRNLINPEKEIHNSKLLDDPKKLKEFLSHKNGVMPAFPKIASDELAVKQLRKFLQYAKEHPSEIAGLQAGSKLEPLSKQEAGKKKKK